MTATPKIVVSLFDYTGEAVRPWAEAGYTCLCFDLQHPAVRWEKAGKGYIVFVPWDSDAPNGGGRKTVADHVLSVGRKSDVVMVFGFPPCTDLAGSGARHWAAKRAADPHFQHKAAMRALLCEAIANMLCGAPFAIENPAGALSSIWRKANFTFNPCDYGGWLPEGEAHPKWADYIPAQDAYKKRTLIWCGNGFVRPASRPVEPVVVKVGDKSGSPQWAKLGGKSMKTKNIRSATPRGFARAVYEANTAPLLTWTPRIAA